MTTPREMDEALLGVLNRQIADHERLLSQARAERRVLWLRFYEEHDYSYRTIGEMSGLGETTVWTELRKARETRAERQGS